MSQIPVDLTDAQLDLLSQIATAEKRTLAEVIRDAIDRYIAQRRADH